MIRRIASRLPAFAMAGLLFLGLSECARADLSVTLNGVTATNAVGGGNGDLAFTLTSGIFATQGNAHGETSIFVAGPANMDLSTLTVSSTGAGTATLIFSMNNIHSPLGAGVISEILTSHFVQPGATGSVSFITYGSQANTLYTTVPVNSSPTVTSTGEVTTLNGSSSGGFIAVNPYSLTQVLAITFTSASTISLSLSSDSSSNFSNPEPTSIAMAFAGLPVLGLVWARRRRQHA